MACMDEKHSRADYLGSVENTRVVLAVLGLIVRPKITADAAMEIVYKAADEKGWSLTHIEGPRRIMDFFEVLAVAHVAEIGESYAAYFIVDGRTGGVDVATLGRPTRF
jgi:hypothetical protein